MPLTCYSRGRDWKISKFEEEKELGGRVGDEQEAVVAQNSLDNLNAYQ